MASVAAEAANKVATDAEGFSLGELENLLGFYIRRAQVLNFRQFHKQALYFVQVSIVNCAQKRLDNGLWRARDLRSYSSVQRYAEAEDRRE